jgi:Domain of unknown function (DUF4387)
MFRPLRERPPVPRLKDVCRYVRSKNAGPFWVTVDLFFDSTEYYAKYQDDPAITAKTIAAIYGVDATLVKRFAVKSLNMVKISYPRATPQGGVHERDMHSGQQFVPLLELQLRQEAHSDAQGHLLGAGQ